MCLFLFRSRCPWLAECFSSLIPIYITVIFLFTLANFCMATFMDPGVFPRGKTHKRWNINSVKNVQKFLDNMVKKTTRMLTKCRFAAFPKVPHLACMNYRQVESLFIHLVVNAGKMSFTK